MTTSIEPVETTNLDRYGFPPLPWSRPRDLLDKVAPDEGDPDRGQRPSAGPPPWDLYSATPITIFGVATAEPYGATRWRFAG